MKNIRKLVALALVAMMLVALGGVAMADTYSITINNTNQGVSIDGKVYTAYKVFDLTLGGASTNSTYTRATTYDASATYYKLEGTNYTQTTVADATAFAAGEFYTKSDSTSYGAYSYSIKNTDWAWSTLTSGKTPDATTGVYTTNYGITLTPSASDPSLYVVGGSMSSAEARALADALQPRLNSVPATHKKSVTATGETVTIGLDTPGAGYYAVYGTAKPTDGSTPEEIVAAIALTNTNPTATVVPKVEPPKLNKKITGDLRLDDAGKAAAAAVGTEVPFELTSNVPNLTGYSDYTFTFNDTLSAGLSFTGTDTANTINGLTIKIHHGSTDVVLEQDSTDPKKTFTLTHDVGSKTFRLTIPFSTLKEFAEDAPITLTYSAVINENALTTNYEKNTATLTYSNNPYDTPSKSTTPPEEVFVIDVHIDVNKIANNDNTKKLAGAKFKLYRGATTPADTANEWYKWDATNKVVTWVPKANADEFTTNDAGKLDNQFKGVGASKNGVHYGLVETVAPAGYNLLSEAIPVVLRAEYDETSGKVVKVTAKIGNAVDYSDVTNGTVNVDATANDKNPVAEATISNGSGNELPTTGGMGTTLLYILGVALVLGAGIVLVARRKVNDR